jgi:uncharacterized membrane protein
MIGVLHPIYLLCIPAVALLLFIILKLDFLRSKEDDFRRKDRRKMKILLFCTRLVIISLLLAALAAPFIEIEIVKKGPPKLTLLVDQSHSMDVMGFDEKAFKASLEEKVPVQLAYIGRNMTSNLGEGILANLEEESNILVVTDGYSTQGLSLADAALRSTTLNTTISSLDLTSKHDDAGIVILGESKTFVEVDYTFEVRVTQTKDGGIPIRVKLDDAVLFEGKLTEQKKLFTQKLAGGSHVITAEITETDYFSQNNKYYKTLKVIDKPKVLLLTERQGDPIEKVLGQLYAYDAVSTLPADLEPYYAVIINDIPAKNLNPDTMLLTNYLMDANGVLVLGGFNSFDRGSYKNSLFETVLPVKVGAAEHKRGDANIVLVIDVSGASDIIFEGKRISPLDVTKALAVEVLGTLNMANRVGVVAFNDKAYQVEELAPLSTNKQQMISKVKRLTGGGQSSFDVGLKGAYEMLKNTKGDRNIIILTDGAAFVDVQDRTTAVAQSLASLGITTHVVGVGRNVDTAFLQELSQAGGGIYFPASESNRLTILFGDPEEETQGSDFSLFILNPSHFITKDVTLKATMNGYNEVVPKSAARMLVTTSSGRPAITVWNYGIGRAGTITVFTGGNLGPLLQEDNSLIISRTINWLIGDPERKQEYLVMINDGYVGDPFTIRVKSTKRPEAAGHEFFKAEENIYESEKFVVSQPGIATVLGTPFAVNNEKEYLFVGMNPDLKTITASTGGKVFKPQDLDGIVEFVTQSSKKKELKKVFFTWPFLVLAILLLLVEIFIRKRQDHHKEKK